MPKQKKGVSEVGSFRFFCEPFRLNRAVPTLGEPDGECVIVLDEYFTNWSRLQNSFRKLLTESLEYDQVPVDVGSTGRKTTLSLSTAPKISCVTLVARRECSNNLVSSAKAFLGGFSC
jgi:hypothetical protein